MKRKRPVGVVCGIKAMNKWQLVVQRKVKPEYADGRSESQGVCTGRSTLGWTSSWPGERK